MGSKTERAGWALSNRKGDPFEVCLPAEGWPAAQRQILTDKEKEKV